MATAVLRSHDCLKNRMHLDAFSPSPSPPRACKSHRRRPSRSSTPPSKSPPASRRVSAVGRPDRKSPPLSLGKEKAKEKPRRLVMGEVRILKRGEELPANDEPVAAESDRLCSTNDKPAAAEPDRLCSTSRLGPEPEILPTKIGFGSGTNPVVYAGPAFSASPEPSSLPFPASFLRKSETEATRGLRCLLRIGNGRQMVGS